MSAQCLDSLIIRVTLLFVRGFFDQYHSYKIPTFPSRGDIITGLNMILKIFSLFLLTFDSRKFSIYSQIKIQRHYEMLLLFAKVFYLNINKNWIGTAWLNITDNSSIFCSTQVYFNYFKPTNLNGVHRRILLTRIYLTGEQDKAIMLDHSDISLDHIFRRMK